MVVKMKSSESLKNIYREIEPKITDRLKEFSDIYKSRNPESIRNEMLFCILTPQSKAKMCWSCLNDMINSENVDKISKSAIRQYIKPIRFYNNKTERMHALIDKVRRKELDIEDILYSGNDVMLIRDMLVKSVKGYGYKEASHFLRNVGMGEDIAILDRHILRNLLLYGIIPAIPPSLSRKRYLEIEQKMRAFSKKLHIPFAHLDILLWYKETGEIFK